MKKLTIFTAMFSVTAASAAPVVYPTKTGVLSGLIKNDQITSQVLMDNHHDDEFYVLPSSKGYAYATGISVANANLGFCQDMINIQAAGHVITERLKQITEEQDAYQPTVDAAVERLGRAEANFNAYVQSNTQAAQIASISETINENQVRLDDLYQKAQTCSNDCGSIYNEIRALQTNNRELMATRQNLIRQNIATAHQITQLQASVDTARSTLKAAQARFAQIASSKADLLRSFKDLYATYAMLEGGTAYFEFNGDWTKQAQLLKELNPTKNFSQIRTHDVQINASVMGSDTSALASLPAFLTSTVDGRENTGTIQVGSYPEQYTSNLRLSLAGACPIVHPEAFHIGPIEAGKVKLGVSVKYQFDSAFNTKIDCTYDEKEMYKKVLSSGSSGALFWKKKWQSIDITDIKNTTFACNWDGLPGSAMTFQERRKFEVDALNYAISRMLMKYGTPQDVSVSPIPPPTSGLSEVGEGLQRLCGSTNIFCSAGGWALKAFDLIFGGGQSTSSGSVNTQSTVRLKWDENLMYPVDGQTNFNTDQVL